MAGIASGELSRLGQAAGTGDDLALFLKVFSGEVLTAFETANVMMPLHTVRTITEGKSAQFPVIGSTTADYFTPGEDIFLDDSAGGGDYLSQPHHNERVIAIDDLLISSVFVDQLDEMRNHYDVRGPYAKELGRALATTVDKQLLKLIGLASEASAASPQGAGGGSAGALTNADVVGSAIVDTMFTLAENFDEADCPKEGRYVILQPAGYYNLIRAAGTNGTIFADRDFGGGGNAATGQTFQVAGITPLMSNHINPAGDPPTAGVQSPNDYSYTDTNAVGYAFHTSSVGTVKLMDLQMEMEYIINRQGHLMVAKMAVGHGILRPEVCFALKTA